VEDRAELAEAVYGFDETGIEPDLSLVVDDIEVADHLVDVREADGVWDRFRNPEEAQDEELEFR
jgi:hypothetical protein